MTKTADSKLMKSPLNPWPWAILLTFVVFISGTAGLVVMACSQKVDLVNQNYYEQELRFQGQIDRVKRTEGLSAPATVAYDPARQQIRFCLPPEQRQGEVSGRIELYRPSAAGQDRQFELHPDSQGMQTVDASRLSHGLWKVRVTWRVQGQEYFLDQKLVLGTKS